MTGPRPPRFATVDSRFSKTPEGVGILLVHRQWDDYGYRTLFDAYIVDGSLPRLLGEVKILQRERQQTAVPEVFDALGDEFCSLGQDPQYYIELANLERELREAVLIGLRDITFDPAHGAAFADSEGMRLSLLRVTSARQARSVAESILQHAPQDATPPRFSVSTTLDGCEAPHELELAFGTGDELGRIIALIGRNGTGKTQLLSRLALATSGLRPDGVRLDPWPQMGLIVAVSFSVFDQFTRPIEDAMSYRYVGLRDPEGGLDPRWADRELRRKRRGR